MEIAQYFVPIHSVIYSNTPPRCRNLIFFPLVSIPPFAIRQTIITMVAVLVAIGSRARLVPAVLAVHFSVRLVNIPHLPALRFF